MTAPLPRVLLLALAVLSAAPGGLHAQGPDGALDLARIFSSRDLVADRMGPLRFAPDDASYSRLEPAADGRGVDLVAYDLPSLRRRILVAASALVPAGAAAPLAVEDYEWSADGRRLLLFVNSARVWRDNTRGDYWVYDTKDGTLTAIGAPSEPSRLMFAKFRPDGGAVGYVYRNDIYVQDLATGAITALTSDGSETIVNGTSDWVYEEELGLRDGFAFSPDGRRVAYWRFDTAGIGSFLMIDNLSDRYSRTIPVQFPKVGTANSAVRVGVVPSAGGATTWFDLPGDPRQELVARMNWAPDSSAVVIQQLDRVQSRNRVFAGDPEDGTVRPLLVESDDAWVDVREENDIPWSADGRSFYWLSERDGWRQVYRVSLETGVAGKVTPGEYDVIEVARIDEAHDRLWIIASPDDGTRRSLHVVSLRDGTRTRVTPADLEGWNEYLVSPRGTWALHTRSTFDRPARVELISLPGHATVATFVDNAALRAELSKIQAGEREFLRAEVSPGVELDGWMMKPPGFDPARRYPVLVYVYGEPWSQTVADRYEHTRYLWHLYLTRLGYVVVSFDNRGTPSPRGRDWRKFVHRAIGIRAPADQAAALETLLKRHDFLDRERVGIWGWSGGGSMSLHAIFKYPELYRMAMSVASVTDLALYDTIYEERYMGLPADNPVGYRDGSPVNFADGLKGDLLLVHGTHDDNVHYQHAELLVDRLIAEGKLFEMMSYPNRSHGIYERANTRRHLFETLTSYLLRKLPAGPR